MAGTEKKGFTYREDGSLDPESAAIHFYRPGSSIEAGLGQHLDTVVPAGDRPFELLDTRSKAFDRMLRLAELDLEKLDGTSIKPFLHKRVRAAGFNGIFDSEPSTN